MLCSLPSTSPVRLCGEIQGNGGKEWDLSAGLGRRNQQEKSSVALNKWRVWYGPDVCGGPSCAAVSAIKEI